MSHTPLLIVHPDASTRALMASMLQTLGHRIEEASCDRTALRQVEQSHPALVLAGVEPSNPDALELLDYLRRKHREIRVILVFPGPHAEKAREALQRGAASVIRFPMAANQLRAAVALALEEAGPPADPRPSRAASNGHAPFGGPVSRVDGASNGHHHHAAGPLPASIPSPAGGIAARGRKAPEPLTLIGDDPSMVQAVELAESLAATRAPVLIVGERGTGKRLLARIMHARGPRSERPFVEVACANTNEAALEVELFGRPGGAGGCVAMAEGGTLYIDEVSALSSPLQARLLRLIQSGEYEPAGPGRTATANVRVVLGTREELNTLVEDGSFRQDLALRVGVVTLRLPLLRHRGRDVERLADHFRERFARETNKAVPEFTPDALDALRSHDWQGNVYELKDAIERGVLLSRHGRIERAHLGLAVRSVPARPTTTNSSRSRMPAGIMPLKEALEGPERQLILQALEALSWNRQETARVLDINRTTLYKKMKKYGLLIDEPAWAN